MTNAAYIETVDQMKAVAAGTRGWISLTQAAKKCGLPKGHLKIVAEALGLKVQDSHGRHGMTAARPTPVNPCALCGEAHADHRPASGNEAAFCTSRESRPGDRYVRDLSRV